MQVVQGGPVSETWVQVLPLPLSDHVIAAESPSLWKRPVVEVEYPPCYCK